MIGTVFLCSYDFIRKAQTQHDPELFKKLKDEIWEFRTLFQGLQYRLLAFWDKTNSENTLVISTHGFVKKRSKTSIRGARRWSNRPHIACQLVVLKDYRNTSLAITIF